MLNDKSLYRSILLNEISVLVNKGRQMNDLEAIFGLKPASSNPNPATSNPNPAQVGGIIYELRNRGLLEPKPVQENHAKSDGIILKLLGQDERTGYN